MDVTVSIGLIVVGSGLLIISGLAFVSRKRHQFRRRLDKEPGHARTPLL